LLALQEAIPPVNNNNNNNNNRHIIIIPKLTWKNQKSKNEL